MYLQNAFYLQINRTQKEELTMPKFISLIKITFLLLFFSSGIAHSQNNRVSPQCLPVYSDYYTCQQLGSSAISAAIAFCKKVNETWFSSGCEAELEARNQILQEQQLQWCKMVGRDPCPPYSQWDYK